MEGVASPTGGDAVGASPRRYMGYPGGSLASSAPTDSSTGHKTSRAAPFQVWCLVEVLMLRRGADQFLVYGLTVEAAARGPCRGEIMGIHSGFLVHWTGKDIDEIQGDAGGDGQQRYLDRLIDDLKHGLYTKRTSEDSIRYWKVKGIVRLCFTEIRLSQAERHAKRYGRLGIGFTRDFIMNKGGRPAIYVPYVANNNLLEHSIKSVYERSKGNEDLKDIHRAVTWIMAHVKRMGHPKSEDEFFEEMEWRLVYDGTPSSEQFSRGEGEGIYRLRFDAKDVKIIVFPDDHVKQRSLENETIREYFSEHMPIMAALADCGSF